MINAHSRPLVAGMSRRLFNYRFRLLAGERDPAPALQRLQQEGWLNQDEEAEQLWLTAQGFSQALERQLAAEDEPESEKTSTPTRSEGPPTEYDLRQRVLDIFKENHVGKRGHMAAEEINRFWAVSGRRAEELRHGLDILMRDGYLRIGRFRKTLFRLQGEGYRYMTGRRASKPLLEQAEPARSEQRHFKALPDESLLVLAAHVFKQRRALPPRALSYGELQYALDDYQLPSFSLFHAAELLHRYGYIDVHHDGSLQMTLTEEGRGLLRAADSEMVQWVTRMALEDMNRAQPDDVEPNAPEGT